MTHLTETAANKERGIERSPASRLPRTGEEGIVGTMSKNDDGAPVVRRIDRILAFMSLGLLLVSVGCFFATMIIGEGVWPVVIIVQAYGPIVAFLLLLILLVMSFARRGRADKR
jgi:hypothetical protein